MEHKINQQQNMDSENTNHDAKHEEDLKLKVLDMIEKDKIKQTSKLYFSIKDKAFWSLFVLSILIGSIAISVMIFTFTNSEFELYQVTHDSLTDFILEMTPYLWVILFAVFAFVGYENFKHTSRGYRYSFSLVLVASLILNVVGGIALYYLGVSKIIDQDFSADNILIRSSDLSRQKIWDQPDRGVLSGQIVSVANDGSSFVLKDFNNNLWTIASDYVPDTTLNIITVSSTIRVIGVQKDVSSSTKIMVACYVLPWEQDKYASGILSIKTSLMNADDYERNISEKRNNNCRVVKPYKIIQKMVELN